MRPARLFAALLLTLIAACSGGGDRASGASGTPGGTIVIAAAGSGVSSLLPPFVLDATGRAISDQVFERLADLRPGIQTVGDDGFEPRLATRWEWARDSMSIAFFINPAARWHDGPPVTARDVRFSFDVYKDPATATQVTSLITAIDSVSVRDSLTAVVWYNRRSAEQFYDFVFQIFILPEHLLGRIPHDQLPTSRYASRPVGSGRFRFASSEPGVRIEIVADTAHYRGRPPLDRVIWAFASDGGGALTQLLAGQADLYENLTPGSVPRVAASPTLRVMPYPNLQYGFLGMNLHDSRRAASPHPIFGDVRVRRAISMALDRQGMVRNVFDSLGVAAIGPYPRPLADTTVRPPSFDRAHAEALLDSAGWRRAEAGAVRERNGRPLAFSILVPTSSVPRMSYAVLIQEQLKAIGAQVRIDALDINVFIERADARRFDTFLMAFQPDPSPSGIRQYWSAASTAPGGGNFIGYANRAFDAEIDSAFAPVDPASSQLHYHRAAEIIVNDAPAVWLYEGFTIAGIHKRIRTTPLNPAGWWLGLAEWSIPVGERIDRDRIGLGPAQP